MMIKLLAPCLLLSVLTLASAADLWPVEMELACDGIDFYSINESDLSYTAYLLKRSFYKTHIGEHRDFLTMIEWNGNGRQAADGHGFFQAHWGCDGCGLVTAEDLTKHFDEFKSAYEADLDEEFATAYLKYRALWSAHDCHISMAVISNSPRRRDEEKKPDLLSALLPVDIKVECEQVDWTMLSARAMGYAAEMLSASYNAVHLDTDGDFLSHVVPVVRPEESMIRLRGSNVDTYEKAAVFQGAWYYEHEDTWYDAMDSTHEADHQYKAPVLHYAWEAVFLSRLVFDPSGDFANVKGCSILIQLQRE